MLERMDAARGRTQTVMVAKVIISCRISIALSPPDDGRSCTNADIPRRGRVS